MKKNPLYIANKPQKDDFFGGENSVLDNTVPLVDFWKGTDKEYKGSILQKSSFLTTHYKLYNINLSKALESGMYHFNPIIQQAAKSLTCCSHLSKIENYTRKDNFHKPSASIVQTSPKCRHKLCSKCNSIKSGKYKRRFLAAYNSPQNKHLFLTKNKEGKLIPKYFYFLTVGLKHNLQGTRSEVFLDELKANMRKLRASKLWKNLFPYHGTTDPENPKFIHDSQKSGYAQSYELTITENGFNIHSHILMCAPRVRKRADTIQKLLREKWLKITGDSDGFRFDLVGIDETAMQDIKEGKLPKKFSKYISECFKYTVKTGSVKELNQTIDIINKKGKKETISKIDLLSEWLIITRGKKMLTSNGFFKGMELFKTNKSKWDLEDEEREGNLTNDPEARYFVGRTADIVYNYSAKHSYKKDTRRWILDNILLTKIPNTFRDITECGEEFDYFFQMSINPTTGQTFTDFLDNCIVEAIKLNKVKEAPINQTWIDKITGEIINKIDNQLKLKLNSS